MKLFVLFFTSKGKNDTRHCLKGTATYGVQKYISINFTLVTRRFSFQFFLLVWRWHNRKKRILFGEDFRLACFKFSRV